jgi:hypothetical protein
MRAAAERRSAKFGQRQVQEPKPENVSFVMTDFVETAA